VLLKSKAKISDDVFMAKMIWFTKIIRLVNISNVWLKLIMGYQKLRMILFVVTHNLEIISHKTESFRYFYKVNFIPEFSYSFLEK
jgi:hypothetical protein